MSPTDSETETARTAKVIIVLLHCYYKSLAWSGPKTPSLSSLRPRPDTVKILFEFELRPLQSKLETRTNLQYHQCGIYIRIADCQLAQLRHILHCWFKGNSWSDVKLHTSLVMIWLEGVWGRADADQSTVIPLGTDDKKDECKNELHLNNVKRSHDNVETMSTKTKVHQSWRVIYY